MLKDARLVVLGERRIFRLIVLCACVLGLVAVRGAPAALAAGSGSAAVPGPLLAWGDDSAGELGTGPFSHGFSPAAVPGMSNIVAASGGYWHALALDSTGSVWAWGANTEGELGTGATNNSPLPVPVPGLAGIVGVAAAFNDSYAVQSNGTLWAWGNNGDGQIGQGSTTTATYDSPTQVPGLSGVISVSGGQSDALVLMQGGEVQAWGANGSGQLGNGSTTQEDSPTRVESVSGFMDGYPGNNAVAVAAGLFHSLALTANGAVFAWGDNGYGELGQGTTGGSSEVPEQVPGLSGVVAIAAGENTSYALEANGTVWAWGWNDGGQLGQGSTSNDDPSPVEVTGLSNVVSLASGAADAYAIESNGTVWAWGLAGYIGNGTGSQENAPVQVTSVGNGGAAIASGSASNNAFLIGQPYATASPTSIAYPPEPAGFVSPSQPVTLSNTGAAALVISGVTMAGQDGDQFDLSGDSCDGTTLAPGASCTVGVRFEPSVSGAIAAQLRVVSNTPTGVSVIGLSGAGLPSGVGGLSFGVVPGRVFGVGLDANGELGSGGAASVVSTPVGVVPASLGLVDVASGGAFSLGLDPGGRVWAWGANGSGQLGDGSLVDAHTPIQVPAPSGMVAVAAGLSDGLALRSDGTVWAWGSNTDGQLGNGSTVASDLPVAVSGLSGVVAIADGGYAGYALRSDGTVWAWGYNGVGGLGNGSSANSPVPVQVKNLAGVVAIAAGEYHALALESNGTVWAWGYGLNGQLGNGATSNALTPVQVSGISTAVEIAAGGYHSLALLSGGTVQAWGDNNDGQVGNGSTSSSPVSTPVSVTGISGITQIAAGLYHSLAINWTGEVFAWGLNSSGQLGNGGTTIEDVPVQMYALGNGGQALAPGSTASDSLIISQPYASVSPETGTITFASPGVGASSSSQVATVTDAGLIPLAIGQASITGADGDEFQITGDGCSNTSIAPGNSCQIGLRYNEKVSETNPVATLRIPSNSPTSPNTIILDPPPPGNAATTTTTKPGPVAHVAAVICQAIRETGRSPRKLVVSCRLSNQLKRARRELKVRLTRGKRTAASATSRKTTARTITLRISLSQSLKPGRYGLTITTTDPTTHTTQTVTLPYAGRHTQHTLHTVAPG